MSGDRHQKTSSQSSWWSTLNQLGIRPSKALGQNFLHDDAIVRRIADSADLLPDDVVVEIGPGLGVLTKELARRAGRVVAIELDDRLAEHVRSLALPHTDVVEMDVLQADLAALTGGEPYIVVANLPYSIAAAAIAHLLESEANPRRLIVMVQREVAERICASPPNMSILAVSVQFFGVPRVLFRIGAGAFVPAPKVESAMLRIDVGNEPPLRGSDRARFFDLVRAGFGQRRKQLLNSIAAGLEQDKSEVAATLERAEIDPRRRAETLTVDEWLRVFGEFETGSDR